MMNNSIGEKYNKTAILAWLAVLFWMVVIFNFSAQPATESDGLSKKVTKVIIETIDRVVPMDTETRQTGDLVERFNHLVRKYAHGVVYFVLGVLVVNAFRRSKLEGSKLLVYSFILCALYAVSDELHQLFVPGRGAQVLDVVIDVSGSLLGIGLYTVFFNFLNNMKEKQK